ncbi:MAG: tRNA (adenosine(37)-N6)-threonylcarbamoyltransferase complex ATPase subunit type 1 TsaE [Rikenellaceae bacterium]|jgi:tRNA threonylcarbamoyladenosine biosynthesis protein TsaE|nr:tRNA (adenosine(37)-N6)-threonylcarbamoyltransferase complex ATPase subunit type 1 TsaE [Rikenellaceae bacterium]
MENKLKISISSLAELSRVADAVIERLNGRNVVAFRAPMGAGKTTLIAEIVAALGSGDVVTSPTFALVNEYDTDEGGVVYHFDFYRIDRVEEAFDMGYEEYFYSDALCLVEWPEKIEELLPDDVMTVSITIDSDSARTFEID